MPKLILCLDFDGTIHSYNSGWQGADIISDEPVPGAFDFIRDVMASFDVLIHSARSGLPGVALRLCRIGLSGMVGKKELMACLWE